MIKKKIIIDILQDLNVNFDMIYIIYKILVLNHICILYY